MLGAGLRLLSILLVACPILMAFQANGWDLRKTLIEEDGVREIEEKLSGLSFEDMTWTVLENEIEYSESAHEAKIPINIYSGLSFQMKILEVEIEASFEGRRILLEMMENEVVLTPRENAKMHLRGTFYEDPRGKEIELGTGRIVIEKLGVIMEIRVGE